MKRAREQAHRFGAEILLLREGVRAELLPGKAIGHLADGTSFVMHSAICASGVEYRRLNLWNEDRMRGAGVYYGAGTSKAELCTDQEVFIVGGGNSAGQAAMHFSRYARKVCIVIRGDGLKQTLSQYLIDRILESPCIEVRTHTEVSELHGTNQLEAITLTNNETGQQETVETCWLSLCLRGSPNTEWAGDAGLVRDEESYLVTGPDLRKHLGFAGLWPLDREPYYLETSSPDMFAAGDVRHGSIKRCASAVGEGALAVTLAHRYLASHSALPAKRAFGHHNLLTLFMRPAQHLMVREHTSPITELTRPALMLLRHLNALKAAISICVGRWRSLLLERQKFRSGCHSIQFKADSPSSRC